ncbi:MAG TPA: uracil phosphoribosyltransferase [Verrucomicrobiales bacterium]|uniref:Uracil phosphoribosyltransferase n=1 Tax=Verrucomicrobia subdivision 6 bacterium BACL9 MAG-120507-bin52 TaxID=1655590 RepID=A0A0R2RKG6_9BACT|nr:MAG: uracil phosphoribosyltransferase [Verrucomicrobia subdivision 6 bacterium BACL9 MAG-120507-bin52]MDA0858840.1 uracil phosphoribosyltransferase [Verrucomicrobiota bacterium]HCP06461.1 uracil phosphoribosyltransferase [Verrucomicrobiales bacterium]
MKKNFHLIRHPLVQHKLTLLRKRSTSVTEFRELVSEVAMLMGYEVTRDLPMTTETIFTPMERMRAPVLKGEKMVLVPILRAGMGLLDGMIQIFPSARVAHIGIYRDHKTLEPVEYYFKASKTLRGRDLIVLDPMLATGNSAIAAVERLKSGKPRSIRLMCLVAAPEGIRAFHQQHREVPIYTAAVDRKLNAHGYILPGLGDAGDRIFGTL